MMPFTVAHRVFIIAVVLILGVFGSVFSSAASAAEQDVSSKVEPRFGVYITSLYDIDFSDNQFEVQFWSWFHHEQSDYHPVQTTELMNAKRFSRLAPNEEVIGEKRWDSVKYSASINQQWQVRDYPFDKQKLVIIFEDVNLPSHRLSFIPDIENTKIAEDAIPDGWELIDIHMSVSPHVYETNFGDLSGDASPTQNFDRAVVTIELQRQGWRLFSTSFIGFFVATTLLLVVFVITSSKRAVAVIPQQPRITLIVGALFSAVGSIYGLSSQLPYTTQFTLADSLQITTFAGVAFAVVGSIASDVLANTGKLEKAALINKVMFLLFVLLSFGLNGHMINQAVGV